MVPLRDHEYGLQRYGKSIETDHSPDEGFVHDRAGHRLRVVFVEDAIIPEAFIECIDCGETGSEPSEFEDVDCAAVATDGGEPRQNVKVGVIRGQKGGWQAVYAAKTSVGTFRHQAHGDTVPDALRALADDIEGTSEEGQAATDGGQPRCGRRNCSEPDPVMLTDERGRRRARCERHALEDIDGIGVTLADRLLRAFDGLRELYAVCEPYAHADIGPARIARLEGCGTRSAAQISSALATTVDGDSLVSDDTDDQEAQPLAADGGNR